MPFPALGGVTEKISGDRFPTTLGGDQFIYTDDQRMLITGSQMRAARALVRWTVEDLAKAAKVGVMTVRRAESSDGPPSMLANNLAAIRSALEGAGVEFIDQNGMGPGVRLRDRIVPKKGPAPDLSAADGQ
jgi:hypothetical protein